MVVSMPELAWIVACRYGLLAGTAFSQGLTMGPLVGLALSVHPGMLFTAFLATAAVFACFSGAAVLSQRRSWLYLSGATRRLSSPAAPGVAALLGSQAPHMALVSSQALCLHWQHADTCWPARARPLLRAETLLTRAVVLSSEDQSEHSY